MQGDDESGGVQVKPALLRVRLDTLTSIISDIDISDEEEESGVGPLDPTALWVRARARFSLIPRPNPHTLKTVWCTLSDFLGLMTWHF